MGKIDSKNAPKGYHAVKFTSCYDCALNDYPKKCTKATCTAYRRPENQDVMFKRNFSICNIFRRK